MKQITLQIFGMTCQGCLNTVTLTLERHPKVKSVEVSLIPGEALVTYEGDILPAVLIKHLETNTKYQALVKVTKK